MIPVFRTLAGVCGALALSMATGAAAQEKQVYRYTDKDGNVVYTDRVPPGDSKDVQAKRLGANYIETNELPLAAQQAMARYPVTLYTFACGELCLNAEGLLNRRGVPFSTVNVEEPKNAERLKALTGDNQAPVLQVGDKLHVKGFNEARWQAMLDEAGYPKAPPSRRAQPLRPPPAPAAPRADAPTTIAPTTGGGYPKP
ncbi:MAG: glutaredoxin family protein [Betaproteobacteria bacterium]|jgi:glutaredoxin|nr:glutaredoxin family protein [Betaproteobacteria bacterium]MBK7082045.1 glutaredoxin family protein [Betaproteobacteria bacterium]MBK7742514.1 glutaredoxin family protein [Betaproteobacteria bacterium]MBK8690537.1 glutaredoxin family protein [Betaproteobacteria bacterium]MBL0289437.1 glutaredoxin family protein [Betaproteobacteria bacterium]